MRLYTCGLSTILLFVISLSSGQRITTIQLDGVQYFVSRMNPYSPELNYFLAYQYCRSLGLQLASFETREKADSITQYLSNAGYNKYDFWTSGNRLGTDMFLWLSTGLPFNATFNYMKKPIQDTDNSALSSDIPSGSTSPQRTARESDSGSSNGCVTLKAPSFEWDTDDCMAIKDFICEQTRCYYYNYGSIPVSSAQGKPSTTTARSATSSTTENKYNFMQIDNIINKLRTTAINVRKSESQSGGIKLANLQLNKEVDLEQSTNGPYDNFNSHAELQDDPSVYMDHAQEDYASTIEPDRITTFGSSDPSS